MNKIEKLLEKYCPNGVEFKDLEEIAEITIGEFMHKNNQNPNGEYPVFNGGISETGFYDEFNNTGNKIIVSARGANAGYVNKILKPYWSGNSCYTIDIKDKNKIDWIFIFYYLKNNQNKLTGEQQKGGIPAVSKKQMEKIQIPILPIEIQKEIVKILDTFAELDAELEAELEARKNQYKYYFDSVFKFNDDIKISRIEDVAIVYDSLHQTPKYSDVGYPMIRVTDIKGGYIETSNTLKVDKEIFEIFTKRYKPMFNDIVISRVGSYGNFSLIADNIDICLGQNTAIIHPLINAKYLYYALHSKNVTNFIENKVTGGSQKTISIATIKGIPILLPSLEKQQEIVAILDKFDALVNDISIGLPAELKARRQQYEYYRNKLLTFNELEK